MAIGYNIVQPNGHVYKQRVHTNEERDDVVALLLEQWQDYCNMNWLSVNHEDPFCAEKRVKLFQDSLAYCLMLGNTAGIVTDYKRLADGKREIPISACPAFVEDVLYGTGPTLSSRVNEFETCDPEPTKPKVARKKPRHTLTRYEKLRSVKRLYGDPEFFFLIVDTDNRFRFMGKVWEINHNVSSYSPKQTKEGLLYDMDQIVCARTADGALRWFDMNIDEIPEELVLPVE